MTSPEEGVTVFTSPYLSAGAPELGEAKGLIIIYERCFRLLVTIFSLWGDSEYDLTMIAIFFKEKKKSLINCRIFKNIVNLQKIIKKLHLII